MWLKWRVIAFLNYSFIVLFTHYPNISSSHNDTSPSQLTHNHRPLLRQRHSSPRIRQLRDRRRSRVPATTTRPRKQRAVILHHSLHSSFTHIPLFANRSIPRPTNSWTCFSNSELIGFDVNERVLRCAEQNTRLLGVDTIRFERRDFAHLIKQSPAGRKVILSNVGLLWNCDRSRPMDTSRRRRRSLS